LITSYRVARGFQKIEGLRVEVEEVLYMPHLDAPPERPHPFVYFIAIINDSTKAIRIRGRKWILKDCHGDTMIVEGEGVVGESPLIKPGERFSYNSYHVIQQNSEVTGSYFGVDEEGKGVLVTIPSFSLKVPTGA